MSPVGDCVMPFWDGKGCKMWMFLALLGAVAAAGVADHMIQTAQAGDTPDPGLDDDVPGGPGTDGQGQGDLLADAGRPGPTGTGHGPGADPVPDTSPVADPGDTLELDVTPLHQDWYGWHDPEEFISTDAPEPPPSDDRIVADADGTPVFGGDGDDTLVGGGANDRLDGEDGDDSLTGDGGEDTLTGGSGNDTVIGGDGQDSLIGGTGRDVLRGDAGDDGLSGGADDDTLIGGAGDDTLTGGYGNDQMIAGEGRDLLIGGDGNDTLIGWTPDADGRDIDGGDFLNGGAGDDLIVMGSGDIATGGGGGDDFVLGPWIDPGDPAVIGDFGGEDGLLVAYDASGPEPVIALAYDAEAGGVVLRVNGAVMAILQGVDAVDPEAVTLMPLTP